LKGPKVTAPIAGLNAKKGMFLPYYIQVNDRRPVTVNGECYIEL